MGGRDIIFLLITMQIYCTFAANILAISTIPAYSHLIFQEKLLKSLAKNGHSVDFYTHFPHKEIIPRYNEISLKGSLVFTSDNFSLPVLETLPHLPQVYSNVIGSSLVICPTILEAQPLKDLRYTKKKYDLLISEAFFSECMLGFGHIFKIPVIQMSSSIGLPWISETFGNSENPSYIPSYFTPSSSSMSLFDRVYNVYTYITVRMLYLLFMGIPANFYARSFFGSDLPSLGELQQNVSLVMVNTHHSINQARPLVPKFIEIGGIHIDPPKPLPKDLETIMINSASGVIIFSIGSMFELESMNIEKLQSLLWAFSKTPHSVICKCNATKLPSNLDIPSNVHFKNWLPQTDLLCHNRTKLFISHGGPMSVQESTFCGVPMLIIPFYGDQHHIAYQTESKGFARVISRYNVTKKSIHEGISEMLSNYKYKEYAEKMSVLFKDRQQSPLETALYWTEYVIKHRGAAHLQTIGATLSWYQYYLLDVLLIFILLLIGALLTFRISYKILMTK